MELGTNSPSRPSCANGSRILDEDALEVAVAREAFEEGVEVYRRPSSSGCAARPAYETHGGLPTNASKPAAHSALAMVAAGTWVGYEHFRELDLPVEWRHLLGLDWARDSVQALRFDVVTILRETSLSVVLVLPAEECIDHQVGDAPISSMNPQRRATGAVSRACRRSPQLMDLRRSSWARASAASTLCVRAASCFFFCGAQ